MKFLQKIYIPAAAAILLTACDNQLDIVPKGQTTLSKTADLELLLNQEWNLGDIPYNDLSQICGEALGMGISVPETMSSTNTLNYAYMAWDETVDRVTLCQSDARYSAIYKYINYCNTLLTKIDDAEGLEERKPQLKAEARVIRAYLHFLVVNLHAAQYDEATAAETGGIAYVTDIDNTKTKQKLTLAEVYKHILDDCSDEVIDLLPSANESDVCRPGPSFGNAVRGKVLMQMKRYDEALPYLQAALDLNGGIADRAYIKETRQWTVERNSADNLIFMGFGVRVCPTMETITKETAAKFESGDYVWKYCEDAGWSATYGRMYAGIEGVRMYMGWEAQCNPYGVTSERVRLAAAECLIRTGEVKAGLQYVDDIRKAHVENCAPYVLMYNMFPFGEDRAMQLLEPVKWVESLGSYENFFDMKRRNTEPAYAKTLSKDLGEYGVRTLAPSSPLWILPFPANATRYNSSLTQNF